MKTKNIFFIFPLETLVLYFMYKDKFSYRFTFASYIIVA